MTTATCNCNSATREEFASEQELVRQNIARRINQLTNNGDALVDGYMAFVNGEYPDAKPYLIQNAIRDLSLMGEKIPQDTQRAPVRVIRQEDAPKPKITMKEIAAKYMGDFIRRETDDCLNLIPEYEDFLNPPYVFKSANPEERKVQKALAFKPHHTVAALKDLMKHSVGSSNPYPTHPLTSSWEERMLKSKFADIARMVHNDGVAFARKMLDIVKNDDYLNAKGEIVALPYTQTQRQWALRELIYFGAEVPWEHITHDVVDAYLRDLHDSERQEAERRIAKSKASAHTPLTPDQEASVLAMFEEMQRATDSSDRKAAARDKKKAKKAAKKEAAALDAANKSDANSKNANTGNAGNAGNAAASAANTDAPTADAPADTGADTPADRGATAVANALARHPEVDLDTALENFPETVGVPKEALTHDLIYRAIIAEVNFQKRQQKFKNLPPTDGPADGSGPKSRSP